MVEGTGLENRQVKSLVGSNPTLSAKVLAVAGQSGYNSVVQPWRGTQEAEGAGLLNL